MSQFDVVFRTVPMIRNTTDQFQGLTKNPALMSMNVSNKKTCLFVKEDTKVGSDNVLSELLEGNIGAIT